jgi:hypothetical protein
MDIHKRGSECQICEYHEWFLVPQTLGSFRRSAIGGCLRCKLLSESASLFRDRWLHLDERADKLVKLGVSKYFTRLTWPSSPKHSGDEEELDIEVTTEVVLRYPKFQVPVLTSMTSMIAGFSIPTSQHFKLLLRVQLPLNVSTSSGPESHLAIRNIQNARKNREVGLFGQEDC